MVVLFYLPDINIENENWRFPWRTFAIQIYYTTKFHKADRELHEDIFFVVLCVIFVKLCGTALGNTDMYSGIFIL